MLRLARNARGRDFVVGDVHGCFEMLLRAMDAVRFDPSADRIVCVGDLVNRGPQSHRALRFLSYDWVACVRGNHEDAILRLNAQGMPDPATAAFLTLHHDLGWWFRLGDGMRADIAAAFETLPIAIELETDEGLLGIVHADVPEGMAWPEFVETLRARDAWATKTALWGRSRILGARCEGVEGIARVVVGHCVLPGGVTRFGNVYGIDTGAVYASRGPGHLSFVEQSDLDPSVPGPAGEPGPHAVP